MLHVKSVSVLLPQKYAALSWRNVSFWKYLFNSSNLETAAGMLFADIKKARLTSETDFYALQVGLDPTTL